MVEKNVMIINMDKVFIIKEMGIKVGGLKGLIVGIMIWKVVQKGLMMMRMRIMMI